MNFFRRPEAVGNRVVRANDAEANKLFPSNAISNTKYNLLSFVPKNLMEQFSRAMNKYFLLIACLQLVKEITPVNPLTTWLPLAVIFGVTAVKEGWDDLGRRKADNAANARTYTVVRGGRRQEVQSRDVHVGDIMMLRANDEVPADLVILSSSDPKGNCFIQTTNLDGESNLKVRSALPATAGLVTEGALGAFRGSVECAPPNEHIYKFDSQLRTGPGAPVQALSSSQLLLQATHLRNTDWVYGLAVYTGNETKFGKNKKSPPTKYTRTDGFINSISAAVFLLQLMLVAVFGAVGDVWNEDSGVASWYLQIIPLSASPFYQPLVIPARFLLLNSTMIPISLKLTLDLCKLAYANYINADVHLFPAPEPGVTAAPNPMRGSAAAAAPSGASAHSDEPAPVGAVSNSTALSEDLGQVKYVLTDKTGTLTENKMVLQVATVCGVQYGRFDAGDGEGLSSAPDSAAHAPPTGSMPHSLLHAAAGGIMADMRLHDAASRDAAAGRRDACALEFLRTLALNNDVVPSTGRDGGRVYKASSPDEEALVKAAAAYGVALVQREGDDVTIEALRHEARETYRQLACFEFSSDRKRMSVILRNLATQELRLYCKGADDMVMARLAPGQEAAARGTQAQIDAYASAGLRTLVYAYKDLSEAQYATFKAAFDAASADMTDRDAAKERVYTSMEEGLLLIGATAIEDKLQDCVPETIALLKEAGIAFWMLTGDKFSTALTIAKTCNLKPAGNNLIEIDGESASEVKPSLDTAAQGLQRQGYQLAYEPIATGWSATLSTLSLGFAGGRTTALPPHRPTGPAAGHVPVPETATMVAVNPLGAGVAAAGSATPRSGRAASLTPFTVIVRGATLAIIFADERLMVRRR
jgi:phospholipid-translocating ATPase